MGMCRYRQKEIGIATWTIDLNPDAIIEDTILHEIAHAIVGPAEQAHGNVWKKTAQSIGAEPTACETSPYLQVTSARLHAFCPECHRVFYRQRKPAHYRRHWCPCQNALLRNNPNYQTRFLTWVFNDEKTANDTIVEIADLNDDLDKAIFDLQKQKDSNKKKGDQK